MISATTRAAMFLRTQEAWPALESLLLTHFPNTPMHAAMDPCSETIAVVYALTSFEALDVFDEVCISTMLSKWPRVVVFPVPVWKHDYFETDVFSAVD